MARSRPPTRRTPAQAGAADLGPPPLGDVARDTVFRALARQARSYPDLSPDALQFQISARLAADPGSLRPLDMAFARAIYHAAVSRWLTLAWLLNREITQGFDALEPRARAALLAGAAQLLFFDRVPAHAAINHAVEWAKRVIRPGAGGLVNAVLRRIAATRAAATLESGPWEQDPRTLPLSDGRVLVSDALTLPDDQVDRLAVSTSHPRALLDHWLAASDQTTVLARALHGLVDPPVILNLEHAAQPPSDADRSALTPHRDRRHALLSASGELPLGDLLDRNPGVWVQDPAAAGAVRSIARLQPPPRVIVDLCAGRGTKTRQLAATFPDAQIIATDVDRARLASLAAAFKGSERVLVAPFDQARDRALSRADLIVLDVPCSNTGVLPRRPEARYRFSPQTLESLAAVQRQLLADSIPLLATGPGRPRRVLYSTCSLEPAENVEQRRWMRHWHRFEPQFERTEQPAGAPGGDPAEYSDGAYSVLLAAP